MIFKNNITILIPAAGEGTRSKLKYPKTLYKINSVPIILRILKKVSKYSLNYSIIIKKKYQNLFNQYLYNSSFDQAELLYQNIASGMGDAVLRFKKSKFYDLTDDILLIWGDIPFISRKSLDNLVKLHNSNKNFLTILSYYTQNPYTYIRKDEYGKILEIIETNKTNKKFLYGERDIGVFLFNKSLLDFLKNNNKTEHNFLYVVKILSKKGLKIESLPIVNHKETLSLNKMSDIKK